MCLGQSSSICMSPTSYPCYPQLLILHFKTRASLSNLDLTILLTSSLDEPGSISMKNPQLGGVVLHRFPTQYSFQLILGPCHCLHQATDRHKILCGIECYGNHLQENVRNYCKATPTVFWRHVASVSVWCQNKSMARTPSQEVLPGNDRLGPETRCFGRNNQSSQNVQEAPFHELNVFFTPHFAGT